MIRFRLYSCLVSFCSNPLIFLQDDVETSGSSEVTSPREAAFTDADDEKILIETEAVNFDKSHEGKVENVVDETTLPSPAEVSNIKGESAASTDDDSSGEISNHVYVAGIFSIFLFLIGFGANILLLEAVRKVRTVLRDSSETCIKN